MKDQREPRNLFELYQALQDRGIPPADYRQHVERFLEFKARDRGVPMNGSFELTPLCNLDCRMCYVHLSAGQLAEGDLLSVENWKQLMKEAHQSGMWHASLTGGECLIYPGFDELYLFLRSLGVRTGVMTNGVLLDERRIDFFRRNPPERIQVTLYGGSEDGYEQVTGHRVFGRVTDHLRMAKAAGLPLALVITPSAYIRDGVRELLEAAEGLEIPYNVNASLIEPREGTGRGKHDLTWDQYLFLYTLRSRLRGETPAPADPAELPDENRAGEARYGLRCGGGRSSFAILHNGRMSPCVSLSELYTEPLAVGFDAAWRELHQKALSYPVPMECPDCAYAERCLHCAAVHKGAPAGHCDPMVCERVKRLIGAGIVPMPEG